MKKVVLCPDHYDNCPLCSHQCFLNEMDALGTVLRKQGLCHVFFCSNPIANSSHHYYNHIVDKGDPNRIAFMSFSVELDSKPIILELDLVQQKTIIKLIDKHPLELNFVLEPDFPYLTSLKNKIPTCITFA